MSLERWLVIFQAKLSGILADDLDIVPAQPCKALASDLAQRRGEIDQVDAGEEIGDVDEFGHCLDVETGAATDLIATCQWSEGMNKYPSVDQHQPRFFSCFSKAGRPSSRGGQAARRREPAYPPAPSTARPW